MAQHLPAYSPELQPVERVWPLVDEPLANRAFRLWPQAQRSIREYPNLVLLSNARPD